MPTFFFPKLSEANYSAFRRLINDDMPEAFKEWERRQTNEKDKHLLEWQPSGSAVSIDVEIDPNEFTRYCDSTKSNYTLETLKRLAFEKGSAQS